MSAKSFGVAILVAFWMVCVPTFAGTHSVNLKWTPSTDDGTSYNIYRLTGACPVSGASGFSKVNGAPVNAATYTDGTVSAGAYCYYATSLLNGAESAPSNLASAVILPAAPTALSITGTN